MSAACIIAEERQGTNYPETGTREPVPLSVLSAAMDIGGGKFFIVTSGDPRTECWEFSSFEKAVEFLNREGIGVLALEESLRGIYSREDYNYGIRLARAHGIQFLRVKPRQSSSARLDAGWDKTDKNDAHAIFSVAFVLGGFVRVGLAEAPELADTVASRLKLSDYKEEKKWLKAHGFPQAACFVAFLITARWLVDNGAATRAEFDRHCQLFAHRRGNIVSSSVYYHWLKAELKRQDFVVRGKDGRLKSDMSKRKIVFQNSHLRRTSRAIFHAVMGTHYPETGTREPSPCGKSLPTRKEKYASNDSEKRHEQDRACDGAPTENRPAVATPVEPLRRG